MREAPEKFKTHSLRLPEATLEALQNMAFVKGVQVAELAREAIEEYIARGASDILDELAADRARREAAAQQVRSYAGIKDDD